MTKTILNLVILNLVQIILTITTLLLLASCAVPPDEWHKVRPAPQTDGLINAGYFTIDNNVYSQHCDSHGNQIWMKWSEDNKLWKKVKYNTLGCTDGDHAEGPDQS